MTKPLTVKEIEESIEIYKRNYVMVPKSVEMARDWHRQRKEIERLRGQVERLNQLKKFWKEIRDIITETAYEID